MLLGWRPSLFGWRPLLLGQKAEEKASGRLSLPGWTRFGRLRQVFYKNQQQAIREGTLTGMDVKE